MAVKFYSGSDNGTAASKKVNVPFAVNRFNYGVKFVINETKANLNISARFSTSNNGIFLKIESFR